MILFEPVADSSSDPRVLIAHPDGQISCFHAGPSGKTVPSGAAMWMADMDINSLSVFTVSVHVNATTQSHRWRPDAHAAVDFPSYIPSYDIR